MDSEINSLSILKSRVSSSCPATIKLNKYLANIGLSSRRKVKKLIADGKVLVNGIAIKEPGIKIDPQKDQITVEGEKLEARSKFTYLALNKPTGVITTTSDEFGRPTVMDLIDLPERLYPIGRLDEDTSGLILLTNDGELTHRLTHPKFHIPKTYQLIVSSPVKDSQLNKLRSGVKLKEGITQPAEVEIIDAKSRVSVLKMTIHEGKHRQIRRMCGIVGISLLELQRMAIGPVVLGSLEEGQWRELTAEEVQRLKKQVS